MINDPTQAQNSQGAPPVQPVMQPTLTDVLTPLVAPLVQQATQQAVTDATQVIHQQLASLTQIANAHSAQIADAAAKAGTAVLANVESDPVTQRLLVCSIIGALLLAGLAVLVAAMLGNSTANRWIAAAPLALGAAVLWVSKVGVNLPSKAAAGPIAK